MAGAFFPLTILPKALETIVSYLPFKYLVFAPAGIATGLVTSEELASVLSLQVLWCLITLALGFVLQDRAIKKLVVMGG